MRLVAKGRSAQLKKFENEHDGPSTWYLGLQIPHVTIFAHIKSIIVNHYILKIDPLKFILDQQNFSL